MIRTLLVRGFGVPLLLGAFASGCAVQFVSPYSADVQKRANALASKQFDNVKGLASEAIADIADHVSQEGLTPADLNAATEDLGRRVRRVAESASEAAFGRPDKTRPNQNTVDAI